jgi:hypothetical protein
MVLEAPAVIARLDDPTMMGGAIQGSGGHLGVAERFMMLLSWKGSYCNLAL